MTNAAVPLREIDGRGEIVSGLPRELYIETTNRCNLKCRTCPQYWGMDEDAADLTVEQVDRILDCFPGVKRVVLHGIGEPLLNRALPEIIAAVKRRDAYALFNTNGLLLRGAVAAVNRVERTGRTARVRGRGIAGDLRTRARRRWLRPDRPESARLLPTLKREAARIGPQVSLWITGMKTNVRELPRARRTRA